MKLINVKSYAIATDGNQKRIAVSYDVINESGKVINSNARCNRVIVGDDILAAEKIISEFTLKCAEEAMKEG
ncbi:MAG: hypothetical protein EGR89_07105 [[Eubacterium] rectale]|nr:hypothetical protein [Agathobacter rectalis]